MEFNLMPWRDWEYVRHRNQAILLSLVSVVVLICLIAYVDHRKIQEVEGVKQHNAELATQLLPESIQLTRHLKINQLGIDLLSYRTRMRAYISTLFTAAMHGACFDTISMLEQGYQFRGRAVAITALDQFLRTWQLDGFFSEITLQKMLQHDDGSVSFVLSANENVRSALLKGVRYENQ